MSKPTRVKDRGRGIAVVTGKGRAPAPQHPTWWTAPILTGLDNGHPLTGLVPHTRIRDSTRKRGRGGSEITTITQDLLQASQHPM